ncbi:heavy-metal-associated domain-containing protein [Dongia sp.]|uniref:heavy-metal-associated domain-containing protein n=1 Tax=Dongia sp. TaxID=1977262 RepID=UPI0037525B93
MLRFNIPNMTCGGCARSVTKAVHNVDAKARIEADPAAREVRIESSADQHTLLSALAAAGFPAERKPDTAA